MLTTLLGACVANAAGVTNWATGTGFQKRLTQPVGVSWSGNPLRPALSGISRAQQVAVLIDRRVDPGQELDLQLHDVPLEEALREIARSRQLGVSLLGSVVFFGPPRPSSRLRTLAALRVEEIRGLPPSAGRKFLLPKRIAWDDFATPQELLQRLADENRFELAGLQRVPHDLWAAADLPPLSLVDRLTLIAVQFDLSFKVSQDGRTVTLVPVPEDVGLVQSYPGGRQPQATAERLAALLPDARIKVVGNQVFVKGLLEEHEQITSPRRPPKHEQERPSPDVGRIRIDKVTIRDTVGKALQDLASQLKLDLRIDHQALQEVGISLEQRISVEVKNVTVDELLREVIKDCPLKFRRRGNVVEIGPLE